MLVKGAPGDSEMYVFMIIQSHKSLIDVYLLCGLHSQLEKLDILNKSNLRDLIAATGLVILLKWDSNLHVFSPCDLVICWLTSKNNKALLLYYDKLCASFQSYGWIQTGNPVRKRSIPVKIGDFVCLCDLEIWWMTLKNNRTPFLYYTNLYISFLSHRWIQTSVTVRKRSVRVKTATFCPVWPWNLTDDPEK